jgi:copper(I)-binding protein
VALRRLPFPVPISLSRQSYIMKKQLFALIASVSLATGAFAQVTASQPWIRATVPQQKSTGAFMQLQSASDARLVAVSSPAAGVAEIHRMEMQGHIMKMHPVDGIDLPAGKTVNLASGGYHIMLMDLKRQLKDGDTVPVTLVVQGKDKKRANVTLTVPVKPIAFSPQAAPMGH